MRKNDIILAVFILLIGISFIFINQCTSETGDTVVISVNGEIYKELSLDEDTTVDINGMNTLKIENKEVYMLDANCPDNLCVNQGKVHNSSKQIVCLPNKVTVHINNKSDLDTVVR